MLCETVAISLKASVWIYNDFKHLLVLRYAFFEKARVSIHSLKVIVCACVRVCVRARAYYVCMCVRASVRVGLGAGWVWGNRAHVCLAVTCHLHFRQNDLNPLHATAVTPGWNGYRNERQHRKLTLDKKIPPAAPAGNRTRDLLITSPALRH